MADHGGKSMRKLSTRLLLIWVNLTLANFVFQVLISIAGGAPEWGFAAKVSFFQAVALSCVWISERHYKRGASGTDSLSDISSQTDARHRSRVGPASCRSFYWDRLSERRKKGAGFSKPPAPSVNFVLWKSPRRFD